jgi:hypothetical protein
VDLNVDRKAYQDVENTGKYGFLEEKWRTRQDSNL